jgi:cytochrome c oxidase subunit 2
MIPWGNSTALGPAGVQASHIASVWWWFFTVAVVVYLAVLVVLALALSRPTAERDDRRRARVVTAAVGVTVLVLLVLLGKSVAAGRALARLRAPNTLTVEVVARQWWWEFRYQASPPSQMVTTANELHVPVGRPVLLSLQSHDVIHSFWVPALHGKRDLIPGHPSTTVIQADRPGFFRGQCAEFCGVQHAKMGFVVIAEPEDAFQAWLGHQRQPAGEPSQVLARRGRDVFLTGPCIMCHTVHGTAAAASNGPDLTHVAGRTTLAGASLANVPGHLAGWVADAPGIKPGTRMPPNAVASEDLAALLAYLETLR